MKRAIVVDAETYKLLKEKGIPFVDLATCYKLEKLVKEIEEQEIYEYSAPSVATAKLKELIEKACKIRKRT